MLWTTEELLTELQKRKENNNQWHQWVLERKNEIKREFYLIQSDVQKVSLDQEREVFNQTFVLRLYVKKSSEYVGFAEGPFFPQRDLKEQLDQLQQRAEMGNEKIWSYPDPSPHLPHQNGGRSNQISEKAQALNETRVLAENLYQKMETAIRDTVEGIFNSAELFIIHEEKERWWSHGCHDRREQNKIYAEICFSARSADALVSEEFLLTQWAAHPDQLDLAKMCRDSVAFAQASLKTEKPISGTYSVLLHREALHLLLHDFIAQLYSRRKYYHLPFKPEGSLMIDGFNSAPFRLKLDPSLPHAFGSCSLSEESDKQEMICLMDQNKILLNPTSHQMAQYMNLSPTSVRGSVVVDPTELHSYEKIMSSFATEPILEILQFSALSSNEMDLTFSSEIRLARWYHPKTGQFKFIKGGNLSGHLPSQLKRVQWGGPLVLDNHISYSGAGSSYFGPEMALIRDVTITA